MQYVSFQWLETWWYLMGWEKLTSNEYNFNVCLEHRHSIKLSWAGSCIRWLNTKSTNILGVITILNNLDISPHHIHHTHHTGHSIMFSSIANIHNKKTKGPTLTELFTAIAKLKKLFFLTTRDVRCVHHRWHSTHRYNIQVIVTRASTWVHWYSSLLQWSVPLGQRGHAAMMRWTNDLWNIPPKKKINRT
jgi:hypothetical protein